MTTCTTYMQQLCRPIFFRWCASNWLDDPHCLDGIETTKRTSSPVNSDPVLEYSAPCPTCPLARSLDVHEKDKERLHQWIELMSLGLCLFDSFSFKWYVICDLFFGCGGGREIKILDISESNVTEMWSMKLLPRSEVVFDVTTAAFRKSVRPHVASQKPKKAVKSLGW